MHASNSKLFVNIYYGNKKVMLVGRLSVWVFLMGTFSSMKCAGGGM